MGLQAQMKTSLPWPSSMLTLLAGISSGPASAIAVSPPLACGLLQSDGAGQCPAISAAPLLASPPLFWSLDPHRTYLELCDDAAGSCCRMSQLPTAQVCVGVLLRTYELPAIDSNPQYILQSSVPGCTCSGGGSAASPQLPPSLHARCASGLPQAL